MRVLVTGGSGFIGSCIADALYNRGLEPVIFDRVINPWSEKYETWSAICELDNIDAVIHCAASHVVSESVQKPLDYYDNNLNTLISILRKYPKKVILSGSAGVYGDTDQKIIDEEHPTNPKNPYAISKLWCEQILRDWDGDWLSLRYFNAAGAAPDHGYIQRPRTHAVPILLDCVKSDKKFTVFGNDHNTPDGTCIRDYIHVLDLAEAHVEALCYDGPNNIFNVGCGAGTSMIELIDRIRYETKGNIWVEYGDKRDCDPARLVADISLIKSEMDWSAKYDIGDIIRDAWEWETKYDN